MYVHSIFNVQFSMFNSLGLCSCSCFPFPNSCFLFPGSFSCSCPCYIKINFDMGVDIDMETETDMYTDIDMDMDTDMNMEKKTRKGHRHPVCSLKWTRTFLSWRRTTLEDFDVGYRILVKVCPVSDINVGLGHLQSDIGGSVMMLGLILFITEIISD